jgi:hypothetical protein
MRRPDVTWICRALNNQVATDFFRFASEFLMRVSTPLKILVGFLLPASIITLATTVVPMSIERLTAESSHVVEGVPLQTWSQWNPQHTIILTYTTFQVQRTLKGQAPPMVIVKQLGGRVGSMVQKVVGVRHLQPGEQAVLFLRPGDLNDGTLVITGLMQGNFSVRFAQDGTLVATNGMPEVHAYSVSTGQVTSYQGNRVRLDELEARVHKAAQQ